jgi:gamma-glutamyltranspeptidase/glutathione hydrolase
MKRLRLLLLLLFLTPPAWAEPLRPNAAAIASAHPLATAAGHEILARGGNAFDAAVAVAAALAVVEPYGSGLGGGGFWLLHRESDGFETMVDARERAPLAATANMYLDADGNDARDGGGRATQGAVADTVPRRSLDGALAAAIPGTPAALVHVARKYGRLPLAQALAPAVRLARAGFAVTPLYRKWAERRLAALGATPASARVLLHEGEVPALGQAIRQHELAEVLVRLGNDQGEDFYRGNTARLLVAGVRAAGGIWTREDLAQYRVVERAPVRVTYGGMRVTAAALPSSGGVVLGQMLAMLEGFELDRLDRMQRTELILGAMRLAYRDRARHLGDPDHVRVDVERLLSPAYLESLRRELRADTAMAEPMVLPAAAGDDSRDGGGRAAPGAAAENTTHFSILDRDGNRAAVTLSLNGPFGSGFMPPGTGVLLNNEMDDFVLKSGAVNLYGLTGSSANAIAAGKRPLSSMTPAFLETDAAVVVLGTPGGSRIITMVLLAALEVAHGRGGPKDWLALPRFHHQYPSDRVEYEPGALSPDDVLDLTARGYVLVPRAEGYGNMQLVAWFKKAGRVEAASDPRGEGAAVVE